MCYTQYIMEIKQREERIKELEDNLKHEQDGSPLQELANMGMREELEELKKWKKQIK